MITPVVVTPREDVPPIARAAATEAVAALPAFSSPEELADAALDAAWPLAPVGTRYGVSEVEIEVVRQIVSRYRLTRDEIAAALGCNHDRIDTIMRRGGITVGGTAGRRGKNAWKPTTEGLAELLDHARKALQR